jgi:hypothetical protein
MLELQEHDLPPSEQKAAHRRYIQYTDAAFHALILRTHHLARTPSLAFDIGCEDGRWAKLLADLGILSDISLSLFFRASKQREEDQDISRW